MRKPRRYGRIRYGRGYTPHEHRYAFEGRAWTFLVGGLVLLPVAWLLEWLGWLR